MIGHNPKANHLSDDFQDVAALLRELPRVAAPMDFNASLKARIAAAKAEANEFAGVTALVKELPRVAAPADFDFKLRARIARAKAEQQKSSTGWFAELFGRTFSWVQASAAMAAVAIAVSVVTFGVLHSDEGINPAGPQTTIASAGKVETLATETTPMAKAIVPETESTVSQHVVVPEPIRLSSAGNEVPVRPIYNGSRSGRRNQVNPVGPITPSAPLVATKVMIKHQSGEARMVNLSEYNLGLQTAHLRLTPAAPRTVETAAINIY